MWGQPSLGLGPYIYIYLLTRFQALRGSDLQHGRTAPPGAPSIFDAFLGWFLGTRMVCNRDPKSETKSPKWGSEGIPKWSSKNMSKKYRFSGLLNVAKV